MKNLRISLLSQDMQSFHTGSFMHVHSPGIIYQYPVILQRQANVVEYSLYAIH